MGITKLNDTTKSTYYAIYIVTVYAVARLGRARSSPLLPNILWPLGANPLSVACFSGKGELTAVSNYSNRHHLIWHFPALKSLLILPLPQARCYTCSSSRLACRMPNAIPAAICADRWSKRYSNKDNKNRLCKEISLAYPFFRKFCHSSPKVKIKISQL